MSLSGAQQDMPPKASCQPAPPAPTEAIPSSELLGGTSPLLSLPHEILVDILCHIQGPWSAIRFTNSCRLLCELDADSVWAQWKKHYSYFQDIGLQRSKDLSEIATRCCCSCENRLEWPPSFVSSPSRLCHQCRVVKLRRSLESEGLELRADSSLCMTYIDQNTPPLKEVVEIMRKMHITHDHSVCNLLIDRAYSGDRGGSHTVDRDGRQRCENKGVDLFQHVLKNCPQVVAEATICACGQPLVADYIHQNLDHLLQESDPHWKPPVARPRFFGGRGYGYGIGYRRGYGGYRGSYYDNEDSDEEYDSDEDYYRQ